MAATTSTSTSTSTSLGPEAPSDTDKAPPAPGGSQSQSQGQAQTQPQAQTQAMAHATRSRAGCLTCRARKVRCSGLPTTANGRCVSCERLGLQCVSSRNGSLSQHKRAEASQAAARRQDLNQAGLVRLRAAASCHFCRSRRQKCSGEHPACARCLRAGRPCVYTTRGPGSPEASKGKSRQPSTNGGANDQPDDADGRATVTLPDRQVSRPREPLGTPGAAVGAARQGTPDHPSHPNLRPRPSGGGGSGSGSGSGTGDAANRSHDTDNRSMPADGNHSGHINSSCPSTNAQERTAAGSSNKTRGRGDDNANQHDGLPITRTRTSGNQARGAQGENREGDAAALPPRSLSPARAPDRSVTRSLVDIFFREMAPLRCLGFLHEPSFVQRLESVDETAEDPLLMAVCALGTHGAGPLAAALRGHGVSWALSALRTVMAHMDRISVNMLMCVVLLHEHFARRDELRVCFMLSALACRICQALQLNVEYDLDFDCVASPLSCTEKETRRRLMWACYTIDTNTACGVEQLKLIREQDVKIQLPDDEESFYYRTARHTMFLQPAGQLMAATSDLLPSGMVAPGGNWGAAPSARPPSRPPGGHRAYYVQLMVTRERALYYIKRWRQDEPIGDPMAEYTKLSVDLEAWRAALPPSLQLNSEVVYIRKGQGMLSALLDLHAWYHQVWLDLYRALIPALQMPARQHSALSAAAPPELLESARHLSVDHAYELGRLFALALEHTPDSLAEPAGAICAYTAIRVKLHLMDNAATGGHPAQKDAIASTVDAELRYLRALHERHPMVARTLACAEDLVRSVITPNIETAGPASVQGNTSVGTGAGSESVSPGIGGGPGTESSPVEVAAAELNPDMPRPPNTQVSADFQLHPLATFRIIRDQIAERHAPERMPRTAPPPLSQDVSFMIPPPPPPPGLPAEPPQMSPMGGAGLPFVGGGTFVSPWELDEMSLAWISTANAPHGIDYGLTAWPEPTIQPSWPVRPDAEQTYRGQGTW